MYTETIVLSDILYKVLPVYKDYKNDNEFDFKQKLYLKSFSAQWLRRKGFYKYWESLREFYSFKSYP